MVSDLNNILVFKQNKISTVKNTFNEIFRLISQIEIELNNLNFPKYAVK